MHGGKQLTGIDEGARGPLAAPLMGIAQRAEPAGADPQKLAARYACSVCGGLECVAMPGFTGNGSRHWN